MLIFQYSTVLAETTPPPQKVSWEVPMWTIEETIK